MFPLGGGDSDAKHNSTNNPAKKQHKIKHFFLNKSILPVHVARETSKQKDRSVNLIEHQENSKKNQVQQNETQQK